eukprot:s2481_g23.t1
MDEEDWNDLPDEAGDWEDWADEGYDDEEQDEVYYTQNPEEPEIEDEFFTETEQNFEDAYATYYLRASRGFYPVAVEKVSPRKDEEKGHQSGRQKVAGFFAERPSSITMPEMWPAWPLGSELSTEHCTIEPYFQDEPFTIHVYFAYKEGQDRWKCHDGA